MSVIATPETTASVIATTFPPESPDASVTSQDIFIASVAAEIVVPGTAPPRQKRGRKVTDNPESEIEPLKQALEEERKLHAIQRATAEQARRVADCLTVFHDALLTQIAQPCFTLDSSGAIRHWNPAMACWTGWPASAMQETPLAQLLGEERGEELKRGCRLARATIEKTEGAEYGGVFPLVGPFRFGDVVASRLTLIPRCRIPGCVESFLLLVTPATTE